MSEFARFECIECKGIAADDAESCDKCFGVDWAERVPPISEDVLCPCCNSHAWLVSVLEEVDV